MTQVEFAQRLEHYAAEVRAIRGVSRTNPHAFVEDKSDVAGAMLAEAKQLRTVIDGRPTATRAVASIAPGVRTIGRARRDVVVVSRRRP